MRHEEARESGHEEREDDANTLVVSMQQTVRASGAGRRNIKASAQRRGGSGARVL